MDIWTSFWLDVRNYSWYYWNLVLLNFIYCVWITLRRIWMSHNSWININRQYWMDWLLILIINISRVLLSYWINCVIIWYIWIRYWYHWMDVRIECRKWNWVTWQELSDSILIVVVNLNRWVNPQYLGLHWLVEYLVLWRRVHLNQW